MNLESARKKVDALLASHDYAERQVVEERTSLEAVQNRIVNVEKAQVIFQEVGQAVQETAHRKLASVVSRCLRAVFGDEEAYEFKIRFERKRGKTEAELVFERDGEVLDDPKEMAGGGTKPNIGGAVMFYEGNGVEPRH